MGVVQNIIGMVRDIHDRQKIHNVDEQLKNYLSDPNAAIAAVNQIDPRAGIALNTQHTNEDAARLAAGNASTDRALGLARDFMRGQPEGADVGAALDQVSPFLQQLGVKPELLSGYRQAIVANPNALLDDKAYDAMVKDRYTSTVATPGSHVVRGGKIVDQVPFAIRAETTPAGSSTNVFNPNTGRFETGAPAGAPALTSPASNPPMGAQPLTVDALRPLFVAQESSGDYTAKNADTGALGRYQVMPKTGAVLAKRVGVAWRPDMMVKDDPASRRYQDAIGNAAIQESIDAGGGDPAKVFSHYYSGSPTAYQNPQGNPKTAKYVQDMLARVGGGAPGAAPVAAAGGPTVTPTSVTVPAKPTAAAKTYRAATPQELAAAGFPKGTAGQVGSDGKLVNVKTPPAANQPKPYDQEKARATADSLGTFAGMAAELANDPALNSATGMITGHLPGMLLGQKATDWQNKMTAFKQNIGLNKLMEFKSQSAQGASGFGNLSNEEGKRLEAAFGSLDLTSSPDVIRGKLQEIADISRRANERIAWQAQRAEAGLSHNVPIVGTIKDGHRFMGGSPENPRNWAVVRSRK